MEKERENFPKTTVETAPDSGVPMFSFAPSPGGAETLVPENFDIDGNKFTGYFDASHKLIFVLDETRTEWTPNILLVMNRNGDRKWGDVLANDYKLDLEDIRPKENNKYQKLDIDYEGLSDYNKLIIDYRAGADLAESKTALDEFRIELGQRLAGIRLELARREIATATATIEKSDEAVQKLRAQTKSLKAKHSEQKSQIGKKPTKESAAKILKIQSQIEKNDEKLKRAELRSKRAKKRLEDAQRDSAEAQEILNRKVVGADIIRPKKSTRREPPSLNPIQEKEEKIEIEAPKMADEPKPLFEQDPEIIDEKIAFQPVEFMAPEASFAPPVYEKPAEPIPTPMPAAPENIAPVTNTEIPTPQPSRPDITAEIPVAAQPIYTMPLPPTARPMPINTGYKQMPITQIETGGRKPNALYYIMLIILIGLSVLTLWLYQSRMDKNTTPELTVPTEAAVTGTTATAPHKIAPTPSAAPTPAPQGNSPFIITDETAPQAAAQPEEPAPIEEPQQTQAQPEEPAPMEEQAPQPAAPVAEESAAAPAEDSGFIEPPTTSTEPETSAEPETVSEPIAQPTSNADVNKPDYEVTGSESYANADQANADNGYLVSAPDQAAATAAPADSNGQMCADGNSPDEDGCCAGESLTFQESANTYVCCAIDDAQCYPPMK